MAGTQVPTGGVLSVKQFSVGLFAATQGAASFRKNLRGPMPQQADAERKLKGQSSPDMPIVECRDLAKTRGEKISVDMFNIIGGKPIMGDRRATGSGEPMTYSSMEAKINQYRKVANRGGEMAQQRTVHELRGIAGATLMNWFNRFEDQQILVHMSGDRGTQDNSLWVVPLSTDPDFAEIMINPVKAPTFNRHFVADGSILVKGGQQLGSVDSTDILKLEHFDYLRAWLDNLEFPMQAIQLPGDPASADEPLFLYMATPSQYSQLLTNTSGAVLRTFQQNAIARAAYMDKKHPLFAGEVGIWNNILVKKMGQQVCRFLPGESANIITSANAVAATESVQVVNGSLTAGFAVERGLLLGAQGLICLYGRQSQSGYYYAWLEQKIDFDNDLEICGAGMGGKAKVRFDYKDPSGTPVPTDHGIAVVDTAVALT